MIYIILFFTSILSGLGIGGGSFFIIITTLLNIITHKEAIVYSLLMLIIIGISNTIKNFKNEKLFDKKIFFKLIIFVIIGSIIGSNINKSITEENLKLYFYIFMCVLGIYEIISSLKSFKKSKL